MTASNSPSILEGVPKGGGNKEPIILQKQALEGELLRRFAPPPLQEEEFWDCHISHGAAIFEKAGLTSYFLSAIGSSEEVDKKACAFYQQAVLYLKYKEDMHLYTWM